ncbi:MAG TPA: hypothetical protein VMH30_12570 [Verrucomicrobiae bacterium]|nr:hypothetical protein [Verrucomicrobiae bacterium]
MNIGKLLAVGKSIVNGRAEIAYRADKQFYLPKFGQRNPFNKAPAEAPPAPAKNEPVASQQEAMESSHTINGKSAGSTEWNALRPGPGRSSQNAPPGNGTEPRRATGPTIQPELSLDAVKVVNNDLSDADVEVVPLKSRAAELPPPKKSWEILGERLLKATAL